MLDISQLEDQSGFQDVLDAAGANFENPADYQDASGGALPPTGNYEAKVVKYDYARKKDKSIIYDAGPAGPKTFPIFTVQSIQIVGGLGEGVVRGAGLLQQVRTKTFERGGKVVSEAQDWLRSFAQDRSAARNPNEQIAIFNSFVQEGLTFRARFDWFAEDWEARAEELVRLGHEPSKGKKRLSAEQVKNIYNKFRVTSMKQFPKRTDADGKVIGYDQIWTSPSGKPIEARLKAVRLYPSIDKVALGAAA
jgi:hypothetical protein